MTKEQIIKKINQIIAKDTQFKGAVIKVKFTDKAKQVQVQNSRIEERSKN